MASKSAKKRQKNIKKSIKQRQTRVAPYEAYVNEWENINNLIPNLPSVQGRAISPKMLNMEQFKEAPVDLYGETKIAAAINFARSELGAPIEAWDRAYDRLKSELLSLTADEAAEISSIDPNYMNYLDRSYFYEHLTEAFDILKILVNNPEEYNLVFSPKEEIV